MNATQQTLARLVKEAVQLGAMLGVVHIDGERRNHQSARRSVTAATQRCSIATMVRVDTGTRNDCLRQFDVVQELEDVK